MSKQLELAQDESDALAMAEWVQSQADIWALPAVADPEAQAVRPAQVVSQRSLLFFGKDENGIRQAGRVRSDGQVVYANSDNHGRYIEWSKTAMTRIQDAFSPLWGRIYLVNELVPTPTGAEVKKLFDSLSRWVKSTYPWIVGGSPPHRFIGPSLGAKVEKRDLLLRYANGKDLTLAPNPKYRK